MNYAGIITAAGLSSRMGDFKPLMLINGLPMIAHTVLSMKGAGLSPVCVVCGYRGDEIKSALSEYDVIFAENKAFETSDMLCSIKLGLSEISGSDGFFLLPGDMPLLPPYAFKAVSEVTGDYIVPTSAGKSCHPPLIKKACYESIMNFTGDGGLPKALSGFEKTKVEIDLGELNRDADYRHEFDAVAALGKKTLGISNGLCEELFKKAETPEHIIAHGKAVSQMALRMAQNLISCGYGFNLLLIKSAGLLHDICRLSKNHAISGAELLEEHGYRSVSHIIRNHMDASDLTEEFNEATIVFIADKILRETTVVTPETRCERSFEKFPEGTEIGDRIRRDYRFTKRLLEKYVSITGDDIYENI